MDIGPSSIPPLLPHSSARVAMKVPFNLLSSSVFDFYLVQVQELHVDGELCHVAASAHKPAHQTTLKGLSHETDYKNFDLNLQN